MKIGLSRSTHSLVSYTQCFLVFISLGIRLHSFWTLLVLLPTMHRVDVVWGYQHISFVHTANILQPNPIAALKITLKRPTLVTLSVNQISMTYKNFSPGL